MEDTNPNDYNALDQYASQLEERITKLEKTIANFSIAGPGISGDIYNGFNYSGLSEMGGSGEQPEGPE